jgi:ankyrin repeat protein
LSKVEIVKVLLDFGANPNESIDNKGNTSLHEAVRLMNHSKQKSHIQQIVQLLLEKGADPLKTNELGKNAYTIADKCSEELEQMYQKVKNK